MSRGHRSALKQRERSWQRLRNVSAQNFVAKNQTNEALSLAKCPITKETLTLWKDLHEIYADNTVTYAGYKEECVRYHGLSSTDGNSQRAIKYNSTLFLTISYLGP